MIKSILTHKNELAIIVNRTEEKSLKVKVFQKEELLLLVARESKHLQSDQISITQLNDAPLILPSEGSALREIILEYLRRFKVTPNVVIESRSPDLIKELVSQDKGICFLVRYSAEEELKTGLLREVRLLEGPPEFEYGFGYLNRKQLSPTAWAFLRMMDKLENPLN